MTHTTLVLVSTMPCEIGAAALYHCLEEQANNVVVMKIPEAKSFDLTLKEIQYKQIPNEIIMIGTYWRDCLTELVASLPETNFHIYCSGEPLTGFEEMKRVSMVSSDGITGPARYLFNLAKGWCKSTTLLKLFEHIHSPVMTMIDDRFYNRNILQNQIFFTGLYNHDSLESSLYEKFIKIFQSEYDYDDIMETGETIVSAQMSMAKERAVNNSRLETLSDGSIAAVTEGPELVNLTHDALHQKYPEAKVTLVMGLKFGPTSEADELSYSIRSFDVSVNAQHLAKKVNGDGSSTTAGGRVKIVLPKPF
jgi:hypothetical protein